MVKITSYTPAWLTEPAPGSSLFAPRAATSSASGSSSSYASKNKPKPGPWRTIARRGSEVFVASGRELRWGDLVYLKELWASKQASARSEARIKREDSEGFTIHEDEDDTLGDFPTLSSSRPGSAQGFRSIKTPVADDIKQLIMSPQSNYLAVLTNHTVHVLLLPDSSHLTAQDTGPLKAKFWTLGPTTHVTSKSAVVSAVWHPLGAGGMSLVTVTEDAVVRLWELSPADRWSFDAPSLAIDLRKLADGTSLDQDFSASVGAMSKGFSPDLFDMEVAAACFGGRGSGSWSSMTLWIAMRGGDVYALCPLLPQRWTPPPTLIPSLSVSIVSKVAVIEEDPAVSPQEKQLAQQQLEWMSDLDSQEPRIVEGAVGEPTTEIYTRPARPSAIPRLQGPFDLILEADADSDDLDVELTDIFVIGEKIDTEGLMLGEDEELEMDEVEEGLSLAVVCLVSTSGQLRICLDIEGVQARWLPSSKSKLGRHAVSSELPSLLTFQTLDLLRPREVTPEAWPMISPDVTSRYSFFITHPCGITLVSLASWVFRLESELQGDSAAGSEFRIDLLVKGQTSTRERVYTHKGGQLAAAVAMRDPDLGYFLLSGTQQQGAVALVFEAPEDEFKPPAMRGGPLHSSVSSSSPTPALALSSTYAHAPTESADYAKPLVICEPRPPFQPSSDVFDEANDVSEFLRLARTSKYQAALAQEMRLSPAALTLFTNAHQRIDAQTERVNMAVGELFRRLQLLPSELHEQVMKMNMLKEKIDKIAGEDEEEEEGDEENDENGGQGAGAGGERRRQQQQQSDEVRLTNRLEDVRATQKQLTERMDRLKRAMSQKYSRELSDKERAWMAEVQAMEASVLGSNSSSAGDVAEDGQQQQQQPVNKTIQFGKRFDEVKALKGELCSQAEALLQQQQQHQQHPHLSRPLHRREGSLGGGGSGGGGGGPLSSPSGGPNMKIPAEVRKAKIGQVMTLLDRESTLVEAVKSRLEKLSLGG